MDGRESSRVYLFELCHPTPFSQKACLLILVAEVLLWLTTSLDEYSFKTDISFETSQTAFESAEWAADGRPDARSLGGNFAEKVGFVAACLNRPKRLHLLQLLLNCYHEGISDSIHHGLSGANVCP